LLTSALLVERTAHYFSATASGCQRSSNVSIFRGPRLSEPTLASSDRRATFCGYSGWTWLTWPQPGEELERVMGIEPT